MSKQPTQAHDSSGQAGALIEITPAMIEAGVSELRGRPIGGDLLDAVYEIYLAMELTRRASRDLAGGVG